jgi:alpha-methylacyl-CoA racemase
MLLAVGILAALHELRSSGLGQVIDASMADGAALLGTIFYSMRDLGQWSADRGTNILDSGAPFYDVYEASDGRHVSVGAIEPQFYSAMLSVLGLNAADLPDQNDVARWPELKERVALAFATRTADEWCDLMAGQEVCFAPVLSFDEARLHPINVSRGRFLDNDGFVQPAPAPRFDRTPSSVSGPAPNPGEHTRSALADWGLTAEESERLVEFGAIRAASPV